MTMPPGAEHMRMLTYIGRRRLYVSATLNKNDTFTGAQGTFCRKPRSAVNLASSEKYCKNSAKSIPLLSRRNIGLSYPGLIETKSNLIP
jgi:hypothetical protein